jgi:hypothetical protein
MAAWLALAEEQSYLAKLGRTLAHGTRPEEAAAMAHEAALRFLADLRAAAQTGARELTSPSSRALASLGRIQGACNLAGLEASVSRKHVARADSSRAACIDAALAPIADEVGDLKAREDGGEQARPTFERVRAVWEWSGRDESVEHFAVDNVTDLAWQIYKKAGWDKLRLLLEPCVPLTARPRSPIRRRSSPRRATSPRPLASSSGPRASTRRARRSRTRRSASTRRA